MRTHRSHAVLHRWAAASRRAKRIGAAHLAAARFEPVQRRHLGMGLLDLIFIDGAEVCNVPGLLVECPQLVSDESDALLWPQDVAPLITDETADAIEARVKPWLRALARARTMHRADTRIFAEGTAARTFAAAAEGGLLGTVGLTRAVHAASPFVYAARFLSDGARVEIACADAALGAAILRSDRTDVRWSGGDEVAAQWYGVGPASQHDEPAQIVIADAAGFARVRCAASAIVVALDDGLVEGVRVHVAQSAALDGLLSFDPADGPAVRTFTVAAPPRPARAVMGAARRFGGGSSGRIALATRADTTLRDGDLDAADALEARMRDEGFDVVRIAAPEDVAAAGADLVHVVVPPFAETAAAICSAARGANVPYAVSFGTPPLVGEPWRAMQTLAYILMINADADVNDGFLQSFAQRALVVGDGAIERALQPVTRGIEAMRAVLPDALAVFAVSLGEERSIRETYGFAGRIDLTPPLVAPEPPEAALDAILPQRPFVFVHAPIDRNANLMLVAQALRASALPLVVAGDVADVDQYETLREYAPADITIVPSPTRAMEAALYRRAAVFLDASWCAASPARAMRAVLCGAAPVVVWSSYAAEILGPHAWFVDPANRTTIAAAVRTAYHDPLRAERAALVAQRIAVSPDAFVTIAGAYARAAAAV